MPEKANIVIVGGGVIGCAIAHELSKTHAKDVFLIERNIKIVGENQSSRNSGVIHAGIYYPKDEEPLKARLCVEGNRLLYDFCEEFGLPHKKTGKLVVATKPIEEEYLDYIVETANENGVPGVRRISCDEAGRMEPNVNVMSAVYVPTSGIVDPIMVVKKLDSLASANGIHFVVGHTVIDIIPKGRSFEVTTRSRDKTETFEAKMLINAAGLYSDDIARMVNPNAPYEIEPVRGESAKFYKTKRKEVLMNGMNVYPAPHGFYKTTGKKADVPYKEFKELLKRGVVGRTVGVHLTPTFDFDRDSYIIGSAVTIGPLYTTGVGKEDYSSNLHSAKDYLEKVKHFFNNLGLEDITLHQAGIQARMKSHRDFVIERDTKFPDCINLIGIDSPGLTASLAIARYTAQMVKE